MIRRLGRTSKLMHRSVLPMTFRCFSNEDFTDFFDERGLKQQRKNQSVAKVVEMLPKVHTLNSLEIENLLALASTSIDQFPGIEKPVMSRLQELEKQGQLKAFALVHILESSVGKLEASFCFELERMLINRLRYSGDFLPPYGFVQAFKFINKIFSTQHWSLLAELNARLPTVTDWNIKNLCYFTTGLIRSTMIVGYTSLLEMQEAARERLLRIDRRLEPHEFKLIVISACSCPRLDPGLVRLITSGIENRCNSTLSANECKLYLYYLMRVKKVWPEKMPALIVDALIEQLEREYLLKIVPGEIHNSVVKVLTSLQWRLPDSFLQALSFYAANNKESDITQLAHSHLRAAANAKPLSLSHLLQCSFYPDLIEAIRMIPTHPSFPHPTLIQLQEQVHQQFLEPSSDEETMRKIKKVNAEILKEPQHAKYFGVLLPLIDQVLDGEYYMKSNLILPVLAWFMDSHRDQVQKIFHKHYLQRDKRTFIYPFEFLNIGKVGAYLKLMSLAGSFISTVNSFQFLHFYRSRMSSEDLLQIVQFIEKSSRNLNFVLSVHDYADTLCEIMDAHPWITRNIQSRLSREYHILTEEDIGSSLGKMHVYGSLHSNYMTFGNITKRISVANSLIEHLNSFALLANNDSDKIKLGTQSTEWADSLSTLEKEYSRLLIKKKFMLLLDPRMQKFGIQLEALCQNFQQRLEIAPIKIACRYLMPIARLEDPRLNALMKGCFQSIVQRIESLPVVEADLCIEAMSLPLYIEVPKKDMQYLVSSVLAQWKTLTLSEKCEALTRLSDIGYYRTEPYADCVEAALSCDKAVLRYAPDVIQSLHNARIRNVESMEQLVDRYFTLAFANNAEKLNAIDFSKVSIAGMSYPKWEAQISKYVKDYSGNMSLLRKYILSCAANVPIDFLNQRGEIFSLLSRPLPAELLSVIKKDGLHFIRRGAGRNVYLLNYLPDYHISLLCPPIMPYSSKPSGDYLAYSKLLHKENMQGTFVRMYFNNESEARNWLYSFLN